MHLDRGPSPLRPPIRGTTPSHRRFEALLSVDSDVHPVIHAGRVAVITGAASGIGRAAAIELAKCAAVALLSLPPVLTQYALSPPIGCPCHCPARDTGRA